MAVNQKPSAAEAAAAQDQAAWLEERVPIRLFQDSDKYRDDVFVCINGEACQIKRGVEVMVKRKFAMLLAQSADQDRAAAEMAAAYENEFQDQARARGL